MIFFQLNRAPESQCRAPLPLRPFYLGCVGPSAMTLWSLDMRHREGRVRWFPLHCCSSVWHGSFSQPVVPQRLEVPQFCPKNVDLTSGVTWHPGCMLTSQKLTLHPWTLWPALHCTISVILCLCQHCNPNFATLQNLLIGKERTARAGFIGITALRLAQFLGRKSLESSLYGDGKA